jgi:cytoskeletal protein RodZ
MKLLLGTAILCMLATCPVYAQQNQDEKPQTQKAPEGNTKHEEKPTNKSPQKSVDKPSKPPKEAPVKTESSGHQQDQQQKQAQQEQKTEQKAQENNAKAQQKAQQNNAKAQQKQEKNAEKQQQKAEANSQRNDEDRNHGHGQTASNAAPGGNGGRTIPEDRYRADFGRAHTFHVRRNHDRFQFGGYWFEFTDAWPSDWNDDDDFYILEIGDVDYLCDANYPNERIVVVITT